MSASTNPLQMDVAEFEQTLPVVTPLTNDDEQAERIARSHSLADAVIGVLFVLVAAWVAAGAPA